jgi:hypothetical protein
MFLQIYQITGRHVPEDSDLNTESVITMNESIKLFLND